ncbi:MAG: 3-dehydroquinate synthase family protein [Planctomycetota bacterium]|nr:3-dehydroquinate synthase family protein [Planctomycetota bacterium]
MSSSPARACIRWPQSTCELVTGSLSRLLELDHIVETVSDSFSAQVLFRDSSVPLAKLDPVRDFFADRAPLHEFEIPGGEACKSPESWSGLLENLAQVKLDRGGLIIVAGGGALGDAAGFAASVWHRGVPWIAIPTTLLAMVDAHVGGKTAIQYDGIKNRIGSFHLPRAVLADPGFLDSLPLQQRSQGWAELIKAAWIGAPELLMELESDPDSIAADLIPTGQQIGAAVAVKVDIVAADPFEAGPREFLNLGHTLAHALEVSVTPRPLHGDAVSIGMVFAGALSEALGIAEAGTAARIGRLLERVGLPVNWPGLPVEAVLSALVADKKVRSGRQRWILPCKPGEMVVEEVPQQLVERLLRSPPADLSLDSATSSWSRDEH